MKIIEKFISQIMVTLQTDKNEMHKFVMTSRTMIVSFNYSPSYVKINVNSTMFYRTGYDSKSLRYWKF